MQTYLLLLPAVLLLLTGCIGQNRWQWQHPENYDDAARQQAIAECEQIAREEMLQHDYFYALPYPPYYDRFYDREFRRFYWADYYRYRSHRDLLERQHYFRICMKAKGWHLVKIPNQ